jgi:hypothetical protein
MRRTADHRRRRARLATPLAAIGLLLAPATALAGGSPPPGVHIDPNSPVAKQYAIPLGVARGTPAGSSNSGKLFGHGITHASGTGSAASSSTPPASASTPPASASTTPASAKPKAKSPRVKHRRHRRRAGASPAHPGTSARHVARPGHSTSQAASVAAPPPVLKVLHPGSGSGIVWMIGLAALVLVLGGAGGFAITGRGRRSSARAG